MSLTDYHAYNGCDTRPKAGKVRKHQKVVIPRSQANERLKRAIAERLTADTNATTP